jgi:hypothetical protein
MSTVQVKDIACAKVTAACEAAFMPEESLGPSREPKWRASLLQRQTRRALVMISKDFIAWWGDKCISKS